MWEGVSIDREQNNSPRTSILWLNKCYFPSLLQKEIESVFNSQLPMGIIENSAAPWDIHVAI